MTLPGGFMGFAAAQPAAIPAGNPVITSLSTTDLKDGTTGVTMTGTDFGTVGGSVEISAQGVDEFATRGIAQTVTAQADTLVTFTVVMPTLDPGFFDIQFTHNSGSKSNTKQVLVGPNQTVVGTEHASGLVQIDLAADNIQTKINDEVSGAFGFLFINTSKEKSFAPRDNDQFIFQIGAAMDGAKDISEAIGAWTVSGANWKKGSQTQANADTAAFTTRAWSILNTKQADFFHGFASQDELMLPRLRMYGSAAALPTIVSTTLDNNPIETHFGHRLFRNDLVWVKKTAHTITAGESIELTNVSAVGGITLDGVYGVVMTKKNHVLVQHEAEATSAATGGGASVTLREKLGAFFDSGANEVFVNFDPTGGAPTITVLASTTTVAIDGTGSVDGVVISGASNTDRGSIYRYSSGSNLGAINLGSDPSSDLWTLRYLHLHHHHGPAIRNPGDGHKLLDLLVEYGGQSGLHTSKKGTAVTKNLVARRVICRYNCTADYEDGVAAGWKILTQTLFDMEQCSFYLNRGQGLWYDTLNSLHVDGLRRNNCTLNAFFGIFYEINDNAIQATPALIENNLLRENGWDAGAYNTLQPAQLESRANEGSAPRKILIQNNVVEIPDFEGKGPVNGIVISTNSLGAADSLFNEVTNNRITSQGTVNGMIGLCGFMCFGGTSTTEADAMRLNAVIDNNEYRHTGPSSDKVFENDPDGANHPTFTLANWQLEDGSKWDQASSMVFDAQGSLSAWVTDTIPTWAATTGVKDT